VTLVYYGTSVQFIYMCCKCCVTTFIVVLSDTELSVLILIWLVDVMQTDQFMNKTLEILT